MTEFRKTIHGVDFGFLLQEEEGECYYKVLAENLNFIMRIRKDGFWKITKPVPIWIKELEDDLGMAIESANS
jgi:hypothetical protein